MRAGATSAARIAIYCTASLLVGVLVCAVITAAFGSHRIITGLVLGAAVALALAAGLFHSNSTILADDAIVVRTLRSSRRIEWSRIGTVRFAWPEGSDQWLLTADLDRQADPDSTLLLLAIPPVERPIGNAYEMRKREQLQGILQVLRARGARVIFAPGIATRLEQHWHIVAPPRESGETA